MSNPNNALGTNGAFGGRTSVNAFNDVLGTFQTRGVLSGWACVPDSGLTVELGGSGTERDVAIAEDNAGNKTTVNNISGSPISVTIGAAPASNTRIDAIVAYIESSPFSNAITDNYDVVNLLTVQGTASATPSAPSENDIRTAITSDGAAGASAYYVVLAYITIPSGTTDIDLTMIESGEHAQVVSDNLDFATSYHPGDTVTIGDVDGNNPQHFDVAGMITASKTQICFSIPVFKSLKHISSITVSDSKIYVRSANGGYLKNGVTVQSGTSSVEIGAVSDNLITIVMVKSTAWDANVTNNTPVTVSGGITFSFS